MSSRILYLPNSKCQQRQLEKPNFLAYPVRLAMEAEWHRQRGDKVYWELDELDKFWYLFYKVITRPENLPFLSLPNPDRIFTDAKNPRYQRNGNFKYHPGTYIMSASGCWHGKCTFCVENSQPYEVRPVIDVINDIHNCVHLGFKEVFDDSATFPIGSWLEDFCVRMSKYQQTVKKVVLGCNMRMVDVDYKLMKQAGFRMLLFGLESANQETLDRINKGVKVEDWKYIKKASEAGLEPHVAVMFGYPWETDKESIRTLRLVHWLLRKGYVKTAQASYYQPRNNDISTETQKKYTRKLYDVWKYPDFWFNQLKDIRDLNDLKYLWKKIKAGLCRD